MVLVEKPVENSKTDDSPLTVVLAIYMICLSNTLSNMHCNVFFSLFLNADRDVWPYIRIRKLTREGLFMK